MGIPKTLALPGPTARVEDVRRPFARKRRLRKNNVLLRAVLAFPGPIWPPAARTQPQTIVLPFFTRPQRKEPQPERIRAISCDADPQPFHREPQGAVHEEEIGVGSETSARIRSRTRQKRSPVRAKSI